MNTWAERIAMDESKNPACRHYGGCGCDAHVGCCEQCPFRICIHDLPSGVRTLRSLGDFEEAGRLRAQGVSVQRIAISMGMSERGVYNILEWGARNPLTDTPRHATVSQIGE